MKRISLILLAALVLASPLRADTDGEVAARRVALDVAGAFVNDGFKLRDGHWSGSFAPGKPQIVQVNLYAGNQYWFTLGATPAAKKISVSVYDETGKPVTLDTYQDASVAAGGFSPENSGVFYIKVDVTEGGAGDFCLIYGYK